MRCERCKKDGWVDEDVFDHDWGRIGFRANLCNACYNAAMQAIYGGPLDRRAVELSAQDRYADAIARAVKPMDAEAYTRLAMMRGDLEGDLFDFLRDFVAAGVPTQS